MKQIARRRSVVAAALVVLSAIGPSSAGAREATLTVVRTFSYASGLDVDAAGSRVYGLSSGPETGVRVFDVSRRPTEIGYVPCGTAASDVAALSSGFVALSFQVPTSGGSDCSVGVGLGGVQVLDLADPGRPRYLGSVALPQGTHTITKYPGRDLVYASPGGAEVYAGGQGVEQIVDVSDPENLEIVATYRPETLPFGCHDVEFAPVGERMLAFCPGMGGTEIWDASDPLAPKKIGSMLLPAAQLPHSVAVNDEGTLAVVGEEAWAGHECTAGAPVGGLWVYDISTPESPRLVGRFRAARGQLPAGTEQVAPCTAHNFDFVDGRDVVVSAWYTGGTSVIDLSDPAAPVEIAHHTPAGGSATSAYWHRGRIYVADFERGLDVLRLER